MSQQQPVSIEDLTARLDALSTGHETLVEEVEYLQEQLQEEREERQQLASENERLREEIGELRSRTDLLKLVENSDEMGGRQRSVTLIQHLRRAAERERDRGQKAKASVNREEAESALQYPDVDRTTIYDDMRRATRLVGDEAVLWYESSSGGGSRLKLNLEAGDLPATVAGEHGGG